MKHAVLIMAHKNKAQLIRLIKSLDCDSFDFFIHPDKNWNLSSDDLDEIRNCAENVYITNKRLHGVLDEWSLVQITLNLIEDSFENEGKINQKYGYFLLLSGQDYPIKSREYIVDFLEKEYPKPLIDAEGNGKDWVNLKFASVYWLRKVDLIHKKMKSGILRKICVAPYAIRQYFDSKFLKSPGEKLKEMGFDLYAGSAWWILPHQVIDEIYSEYKTNKKLIKIYKKTITPEETFFQVMAIHSSLGEEVKKSNMIEVAPGVQKCMTYANFTTPTKKFRGHPHDILVEDFDRIMAKKQLFARKFDMDKDEKIFDMIDEVTKNYKKS
jgi:hypothetical protein